MTRHAALAACGLMIATLAPAGDAGGAPAKRAPKPRFLVQVGVVSAVASLGRDVAPTVRRALVDAVAQEPLLVGSLGVEKLTPRKRRLLLARRRLSAYALSATVTRVETRVQGGSPRTLLGEATLEVTLTRQRPRAKPVTLPIKETVSVPVSVVLRAERIAVSRAALLAAARAAVGVVRDRLAPPRKARGRRRR